MMLMKNHRQCGSQHSKPRGRACRTTVRWFLREIARTLHLVGQFFTSSVLTARGTASTGQDRCVATWSTCCTRAAIDGPPTERCDIGRYCARRQGLPMPQTGRVSLSAGLRESLVLAASAAQLEFKREAPMK